MPIADRPVRAPVPDGWLGQRKDFTPARKAATAAG